MALSLEQIKGIVRYNPQTGIVTRVGSNRQATRVNSEGYLSIRIDYVSYKVSRLIWVYMTGEWPVGDIDHVNGDRTDNVWENLRDVPRSKNCLNRTRCSNNTSGIKGVYLESGRWVGQVTYRGRTYKKRFDYTQQELAIEWVRTKRVELHGEFANHG